MNEEPDLTEQRRILCVALRRHRLNAGLTQNEASAALEWSRSKFIRVENGRNGIRVTDLQALLKLYGVADGLEIASLTAAARSIWRRPGLGQKRMSFRRLVKLADDVTGINGCGFTAAELSERWSVPATRAADAVEAAGMLRELRAQGSSREGSGR